MALPDDALTSAMGAVWVQINGPNTRPVYAGCQTVDDVEGPEGDVELIRCFDPSGRGWKTVGQTQAPPDPVTTTITGLMFKTASVMEMLRCPAVIYLLTMCGEGVRKDIFTNYDRGLALNVAKKTNNTWSNLVHREEDNASEYAVDISANPPAFVFFNLKAAVARQSTDQAYPLNDIDICGEEQCAGVCGILAHELCESLVAAGDTLAGSPGGSAEVIYTEDKGTTWTATAADPFAAGEDVSAVVCFQLDKDTNRIIVARGTADGLNPAEIAYSDDSGATWTNVDVGAVDGQFAPDNDSLFALDRNNIWMSTNDGYIYKSEDAGESWTAQEQGVITATDIFCVNFADANNGFFAGENNVIARTTDGGQTWSAVTAPAAKAGDDIMALEYSGRWWFGYSDGELYFTEDGGDSFEQRTYDGMANQAVINKISFATELHGFFVSDTAAPVGTVYHTVDGGYTWQPLTTTTNLGLNSIVACDPNLAYAVGEVGADGTAVILKVNVYPDVT